VKLVVLSGKVEAAQRLTKEGTLWLNRSASREWPLNSGGTIGYRILARIDKALEWKVQICLERRLAVRVILDSMTGLGPFAFSHFGRACAVGPRRYRSAKSAQRLLPAAFQ
jgi:hypothetical protein